MFDGWGRRLFVYVCHLFIDQWVGFGDREPPDRALLAKLWRVFPPQPSERTASSAPARFVLSIAK